MASKRFSVCEALTLLDSSCSASDGELDDQPATSTPTASLVPETDVDEPGVGGELDDQPATSTPTASSSGLVPESDSSVDEPGELDDPTSTPTASTSGLVPTASSGIPDEGEASESDDSESNTDDGGLQKTPKSRKRVRRPNLWKKTKRVRRRNQGKGYVSSASKQVR